MTEREVKGNSKNRFGFLQMHSSKYIYYLSPEGASEKK